MIWRCISWLHAAMYYTYIFFINLAIHHYEVMTHWINGYDRPVNFQCPDSYTISYWRSVHDNGFEDRLFDLSCEFLEQTTALTPICSWTGYVNTWDQTINFYCPNNGYINGFHSVHHNYYEDRRMSFRCCYLPDICAVNCRGTGWVNDYDREVRHIVPIAEILHGIKSQHYNATEDRIWGFTNCYYQRCNF